MENSKLLFGVAGVLLLVVVGFYGWRWFFSSPRERSAEELAQAVLSAGTPEEQASTAAELAGRGWPALAQMQRLARESKLPAEVRAAMIQGLGAQGDYDSMPLFLDGMDDPAMIVRVRSAAAVVRILCTQTDYRPEDSPEERQAAVKALRDTWEKLHNGAGFEKARAKLIEARQNSQ